MTIPITVLMSIYNGERFIRESISSVLNQSFKEFEFIIINDGSTDSSEHIIREFCSLDKRINLFNKQNSGLTKSLNLGIKMAKGEWIARIDDDDICEPERLEVQYSYAKANKSLVLIGSDFSTIDFNSLKLKVYKSTNQDNRLKKLLLKKKSIFPHSSFFINNDSIRKINGYNERIKRSQDYDLCLRLSEIGEIACIKEPLVRIRKHNYQISHEDNGMRQIVDSSVALVGYLLEKKGLKNPISSTSSDILFEEFYNFIKNDISLKQFFKYRLLVQQVKTNFLNFNLITLFTLLIKSFHFLIYYFMFCLININIDIQILNKWIRKKALCVD
jgi:glycosyltransferase involved in cell wall biosynthesis